VHPDFLVIGAQKAGTTWLDRNLRLHPQLWLPPEKEIHFFDFPPLMPFSFLRYIPSASIRSWVNYRMNRDWRKVQNGEQSEEWFNRYYHGVRTWRWYGSLFTPAPGQLAGEATPRYAVLSERKIRTISAAMPRCKIIYLLRNPIERMWSDLAMFHGAKFGHAGLQTIDENKVLRFLTQPGRLAHSRYSENIGRWEKHFPREQIFIGFQDQIRETPHQLIESIYGFLGVDTSAERLSTVLTKKINVQEYPPIPDHIGTILSSLLIDEVRRLHRSFNNTHTAQWLAQAEKLS
jgi:hypothetical protein